MMRIPALTSQLSEIRLTADLNIEPVLQSADVKDGETSVNQEEATSTSRNTQRGRGNSSHVAAVNATVKDKCGTV